jgi:hypothetical protein
MKVQRPPGLAFDAALATAIADYQLNDVETDDDRVTGSSVRKRAFREARAGSKLASVSLVRDEEVLRWVYEPPPASIGRRRGRRALSLVDPVNVIPGFQFREIPPNEVRKKLSELDDKLTPNRGLRAWVNGKPQAYDAKKMAGPLLLLIHGTFSKGDMYLEEFGSTPEGKAFLANAAKKLRCDSDIRSPDADRGALAQCARSAARARSAEGSHRCRLPQPWGDGGVVVVLFLPAEGEERRVRGVATGRHKSCGAGSYQERARLVREPRPGCREPSPTRRPPSCRCWRLRAG